MKAKSQTSRKDVTLQIWVMDRAGGGSKSFYCRLGAFVNKNNNQSKNFYELLISVWSSSVSGEENGCLAC